MLPPASMTANLGRFKRKPSRGRGLPSAQRRRANDGASKRRSCSASGSATGSWCASAFSLNLRQFRRAQCKRPDPPTHSTCRDLPPAPQ
jgi:hypothetical protein